MNFFSGIFAIKSQPIVRHPIRHIITGYSPDTSTREIYVAGNGGNSGSVTLKAFGDIVTNSIRANSNNGIGGAVRLTSQKGKIDTNGEAILTFSNSANAGNVILKADLGVSTGEINAYVSGGGGKGGVIRIDAGQDIFTGLISASSQNGDGRDITITSINGSINTNGGAISSTSFAAGNAGTITLKSAKDIKVGDIFARSRDGEIASTGGWNGGKVSLTSSLGNVEARNITTTSITGNAGNVIIKAISRIKVGNVDTFARNNGDAGDVSMSADDDIETLAIIANVKGDGAGKGIGGTVKLISKMGDILTNYVRTDSAGNVGGNITLDAGAALLSSAGIGGTVRVINSFSFAGQDFSLYAGMREGSTINVKYCEASFAIGDASTNGTKGSVMSSASLVADWKIDNKFKLASQTKKIELSFESYINNFTALENRVNALVNISYQTEYLSNIVKTIFQPVYSAINYFYGLLGAIPPMELKDIFTGYVNDVKTLQAAKALTETAALKDSKYSGREELAARSILPVINLLLTTAKSYSVTDKAQIAYIIATVSHESQFGIKGLGIGNSNPMYEYGDINYFNGKYVNEIGNGGLGSGDAFRYRGRGYVQLTGKANYEKFQNLLNVDITATTNGQQINGVTQYTDEADPDKVAIDRVLAAKITVLGMRDDLYFSSYSNPAFGLSKWLRDTELNPDFINARNLVNSGLDKAQEISDQAIAYLATLRKI